MNIATSTTARAPSPVDTVRISNVSLLSGDWRRMLQQAAPETPGNSGVHDAIGRFFERPATGTFDMLLARFPPDTPTERAVAWDPSAFSPANPAHLLSAIHAIPDLRNSLGDIDIVAAQLGCAETEGDPGGFRYGIVEMCAGARIAHLVPPGTLDTRSRIRWYAFIVGLWRE
ncbi:hypothetical protein K8R03_01400 [Candidatus Kaiserbacteria bacterium]|nr:hypothetical protein [Candidatus Kaiserbacteria bacterium]